MSGNTITPVAGVPDAVLVQSGRGTSRAVVFGSVHGDEPSGAQAIDALLFELASGRVTLRNGSLLLVRGNPPALARGVRGCDDDLNRLFRDAYPEDVPRTSHEFRRAQELKPLLRGEGLFLCLHSSRAETREPLLLCDGWDYKAFRALGVPNVIAGWDQLGDRAFLGSSSSYAHTNGMVAATLEAGSHDDPETAKRTLKILKTTLSAFGYLDRAYAAAVPRSGVRRLLRVQCGHEVRDRFRFTHALPGNLAPYRKGAVIGSDAGHEVRAPSDGYLLFPAGDERAVPPGKRVFFWCTETSGRELHKLFGGATRKRVARAAVTS